MVRVRFMEALVQPIWTAAPACLPKCSRLLPDLSLAQASSLSWLLLPRCKAWWLLPYSLLAGVGWEENLAQDAWELAAPPGRRWRKGGGLLVLWKGKAAQEWGGRTRALGETRLSVLNQWNCKILVCPLKFNCENTHRVLWDHSEWFTWHMLFSQESPSPLVIGLLTYDLSKLCLTSPLPLSKSSYHFCPASHLWQRNSCTSPPALLRDAQI